MPSTHTHPLVILNISFPSFVFSVSGNQKLIPHNGHKRIQEEREGGGLVLLAFACKVQNHIICTIQLNPQPCEYAFISWFHNQNPMPTNQRVACDHCAQLTSAYLIHFFSCLTKFGLLRNGAMIN